jgi:TrmH family RNA methyltransferase
MISIRELKYYSSLLIKKFRTEEKKFLVEGTKIVEEGLNSNYECEAVFATASFIDSYPEIENLVKKKTHKLYQLKSQEFQKISDTKSPQGIAAVFLKPETKKSISNVKDNRLVLLDNISDPGNLGTILRTCDWFGLKNILITSQSVEYLNPKVIRASMGSIFHLTVFDNLVASDVSFLKEKDYEIICSDINGISIYDFNFPSKYILTFSNESTGPSEMIKNNADQKITIPRLGKAESLNVASAAAIILSLISK